MRYAIGRIAFFSVAVAKARVETTIHTLPTQLVVRAIGESLQPDPILGLPEAIGHIKVEIKKGGVGSFGYGPIG